MSEKKKAVAAEKAAERIALLKDQQAPVLAEDAITEAGRKVLLNQFITMLEREAGSKTGENIEDVHKMRVSIRHMRSALLLLDTYYKSKKVSAFQADLRTVMKALGDVRDLDVMIRDLTDFQASLAAEEGAVLQEVLDVLDQRRGVSRKELVKVLESKDYRAFVKRFSKFLTSSEKAEKAADHHAAAEVTPYQVRHVLPPIIYEHLADVRAYETVLDGAPVETLHALRIEVKQLRYAVALFGNILGTQATDYIESLKLLQDYLGQLNDIHVAVLSLTKLMEDLEGHQNAVLWLYINHLEEKIPDLIARMPANWKRFAAKTVQRKLAAAIIAL